MNISRRNLLVWLGVGSTLPSLSSATDNNGTQPMFGLIGKMIAVPGKRQELAQILIDGVASMPGCLSYIVANDSENSDAIWITEVWESREAHKNSLSLPSVQEAIKMGKSCW